MKTKELIEELQKCNPDAKVKDGNGNKIIAVKSGCVANSAGDVVLLTK